MSPEGDALALARELRNTIAEIGTELDKTAKVTARTRRLTIALTVSVIADIVLSVVLAFVVVHEHTNAAAIKANQIRACRIGNDARAAQRRLWSHVIDISEKPRPSETPAERADRLRTLHQFKVFIAREFHNVNCRALYNGAQGADAVGVSPELDASALTLWLSPLVHP